LGEQIVCEEDAEKQSQLISVYKHAVSHRKQHGNPRTIRQMEDINLDDYPEATDTSLIHDTAYNLVAEGGPLHDKAQEFVRKQNAVMRGYRPQARREKIVFSTSDAGRMMNVDTSNFSEGVIAFDIETDTSHDYGLRAQRS